MNAQDLSARAHSSWSRMSPREQRGLGAAAAVLAVALIIGLGVWPALKVLHNAPGEQLKLDQQLATMQRLEARAQQLRALPRTAPANSEQALRQTLQPLAATAQLQLTEQRAQVTLNGADPLAVATWWQQARTQAQAVAQEAQLVRKQVGDQTVWDGQVVMGLAPR